MRSLFPIALCGLLLSFGTLASAQKDVRGSEDHPMLARYPETYIKKYAATEYDRSVVIAGPIVADASGADVTQVHMVEGQVISHKYIAKGAGGALYDGYKSYLAAFDAMGATLVYSCADTTECTTPNTDTNVAGNINEFRQRPLPFLKSIPQENRYDYAIITAEIPQNGQAITAMVILSASKDLKIDQTIIAPVPFDDQKIQIGSIADLPKVVSSATAARKDQIKGSKDHTLLKRYPGFYINKYAQVEYDQAQVVTGRLQRDDQKRQSAPALELEGQVTNIAYKSTNPTASTYQIILNYKVALEKLGAEIIFECETTAACTRTADGHDDIRIDETFWKTNQQMFKGISPKGAVDANILTARLIQGDTTVHFMIVASASHANGDRFINQSIIVDTPFDPNKVGIGSIEDLTISIADSGAVVLEGVLFEFDSATLLPESHDVLDIVNQYILQNKTAEFFVVGHTDSTGKYQYNVDLSQRRAKSVVDYLAKNGAERKKLLAVGVGSVSPIANNETEVGQKSNRRVELVIR
ncbi:hypothetical protein GCM10007939_20660 [Amylibacter marinus]|uniref:OmpA-like domain-containing protein n=1 Tax=Amylibacter marinus TaxID=1475483 RepID=A0ABQ5VWF7_9RHOB|nr:OmpA family protein [Amylibacter marinus]GLQ35783.1 hypothetical protein GCM10007939_20660 [Amylibacter marinus]